MRHLGSISSRLGKPFTSGVTVSALFPSPPSRKGLERKRLILKVALRIIGRDGLVKLSMRTLAAEAEIPLGALGYYFSSKEQLIREAFETHLVNELHRVVRTVSSIGEAGSPEDLARVLAEFVIEGLQDSDHSLIAEYEFIVEASRRGELARESSAWQQSLRTQLLMTFERFGSSDPETDARLTLAVLGQVPWSGVTNILRE